MDLQIGELASGTASEVNAAASVQREWEDRSASSRAKVFTGAAELFQERKFEFAVTLSLENRENRTKAMADIDEAIDFLEFYSREITDSNGYRFDTGELTSDQHTTNLLRPYGVFTAVSPFNFPITIIVGMNTGVLITGNTAVVKSASATPLIAHKCVDLLESAGIPDDVVNLVTGGGSAVGQPLVEHEDVADVAFTGSQSVGPGIEETFSELGKCGPVIAELGDKNPVFVSDEADIDAAVEDIMKGAFSFSGQKCSATSRVYVYDDVAETEKLLLTNVYATRE